MPLEFQRANNDAARPVIIGHAPNFAFQRAGRYLKMKSMDVGTFKRTVQLVHEAIEKIEAASKDWNDRSDEEKDAVLQAVRDAGAQFFDLVLNALEPEDGASPRKTFMEFIENAPAVELAIDGTPPWEWMYLGDPKQSCDPGQFFGSDRVFVRPSQYRPVSHIEPKLAKDWDRFNQEDPRNLGIRMAQDERLESATSGAEAAIFHRHRKAVQILIDLDPVKSTSLNDFFAFFRPDYQLAHFNCHAELPDTASDPSTLCVTRKFGVSDGQLRSSVHIVPRGANIFLNCCNGLKVRFSEVDSLGHAYMSRGAGMVVSTTGPIEDGHATIFAGNFYDRFFAGDCAGDAFIYARSKTIGDTGNPASLCYSMLGSMNKKHK